MAPCQACCFAPDDDDDDDDDDGVQIWLT